MSKNNWVYFLVLGLFLEAVQTQNEAWKHVNCFELIFHLPFAVFWRHISTLLLDKTKTFLFLFIYNLFICHLCDLTFWNLHRVKTGVLCPPDTFSDVSSFFFIPSVSKDWIFQSYQTTVALFLYTTQGFSCFFSSVCLLKLKFKIRVVNKNVSGTETCLQWKVKLTPHPSVLWVLTQDVAGKPSFRVYCSSVRNKDYKVFFFLQLED